MPKGYAEGPAAEEAERRREELAEGTSEAPRETRVAVEGSTPDDAERHFLGWADEVDADAALRLGRGLGDPARAATCVSRVGRTSTSDAAGAERYQL